MYSLFLLRTYTFNNVNTVEPGPTLGPVLAPSLRDVWIKQQKQQRKKYKSENDEWFNLLQAPPQK